MLYLVKKKQKKINNLQQLLVSRVYAFESLKRQVRFLVLLTSAS